jgi:hypothetical protein
MLRKSTNQGHLNNKVCHGSQTAVTTGSSYKKLANACPTQSHDSLAGLLSHSSVSDLINFDMHLISHQLSKDELLLTHKEFRVVHQSDWYEPSY